MRLEDDCGDSDFALLVLSTTSTLMGLGELGLCCWLPLTSSVVEVVSGLKLPIAIGGGLEEVLSIGRRIPASIKVWSVCVPVEDEVTSVIAVL